MNLLLKKLHPEAQLPTRAYPTSVGLDLYAFILDERGVANNTMIPPGTVKALSTGLLYGGIRIPTSGHYVEGGPHPSKISLKHHVTVCSRSGLALKSLFVANSPGIVDPEYRGEIKVLLLNAGHQTHFVRHGDRIAQLVVNTVLLADPLEVEELAETERGEKGFGSSGR